MLLVLAAAPGGSQPYVRVTEGDLGPGLSRALWGHYAQTGGKFGAEDDDAAAIAPGSAAHAAACTPGCAALPYLGAQVASGCSQPEAFLFRYWRSELFAGVQKLWLDPGDITGLPCTGACQGSAADVVECQMRSIPYDVEAGMDRDGSGNPIPGTGHLVATYHEALRGILAEGLTPNLSLRSPFRDPRDGPCGIQALTCTTPACLADLAGLVGGLYEYVRRNSGGGPCEPRCDFPRDALDRILWSLVSEPDLGTGMGFFGPYGHGEYGKQLDALLAVPYPAGFTRRVAAPDITSALAVDDATGQRASWLATVRHKVDFVTYHGLYCGEARNLDTNLLLPAILRAELGTAQPLLCTELANNENLPREGPCGGQGCSGGTMPDCGANRLVGGMLDQTRALLYQMRSHAGLAGALHLGLFEGPGVGCGGSTGAGVVGTTTRELDAARAGKEMYVQNPSITAFAFRMVFRELGWNGEEGSVVLPSSANGGLVEAARRFPDRSVAVVVVNDGDAVADVGIDLSALAFPEGPLRAIVRVVAPAMVDGQGMPAPLLDAVVRDEVQASRVISIDLPARSVTSLRAGPAGVPFVPRILGLEPLALPACGGTVAVVGEGIGPGDAAVVGGERTTLGACAGDAVRRCELQVPARRLPSGADRDALSVRVIRTASAAPSDPASLAILQAPEICGVEPASVRRGGVVVLRGRGLAAASRAALLFGGGCPACGSGPLPSDRLAVPLCVVNATDACGPGVDGELASFLVPSAIPPDVRSLHIAIERDDPATGVTVRGACVVVELAAGEPPPPFCIERAGGPCGLPAVAHAGSELLFRATASVPSGSTFRWSFGDGTSMVTQDPVARHRYAAEATGGMDVALAIALPGEPCPVAAELGDVVFLADPAPPRILAGPGREPTNPPRLRGLRLAGGQAVPAMLDVRPYAATAAGLRVASGDVGVPGLSGQATASLLTGPGPGPTLAPHVRGFHWQEGGVPIPSLGFFAYGTLRHGVGPATGEILAEGPAAILTAPGPGAVFGPHVRGFRHAGHAVEPLRGVSFWAYGTLRYGANAAAGDLDDDVTDDIVTGPGPGGSFAPNVRGFAYDGRHISGPRPSFVAHAGFSGARVGVARREGRDAILEAPGPGADLIPVLRRFEPPYGAPETAQEAVTFPGLRYGATVAGADLDGDGRGEAIAGEGPDPAASSRLRAFDAGLQPMAGIDVAPFASVPLTGGCEVGGSDGTR